MAVLFAIGSDVRVMRYAPRGGELRPDVHRIARLVRPPLQGPFDDDRGSSSPPYVPMTCHPPRPSTCTARASAVGSRGEPGRATPGFTDLPGWRRPGVRGPRGIEVRSWS